MWRIALYSLLFLSVTLNLYLFVQLNIRTIEKKLGLPLESMTSQHALISQSLIKKSYSPKSIRQTTDSALTVQGHSLSEEIKTALNAQDYFLASFLIKGLTGEDRKALAELKVFWYHDTQALIKQDLFSDAEKSIIAFLEFMPDDVDFLYLQVDLYSQKKLPLSAIKYAYTIQYHVFSEAEIADVIRYARELVGQKISTLIKNNSWVELLELIEEVSILDPEDVNLQWVFSRAQYQLGEFEQAKNALEPLLTQPNFKVKAQALLAEIEAAIRKPASIPLNRQGQHYIVEGNMDDAFNVSLMIDTGASVSLLSELAFSQLNQYTDAVYVKDLTLNTAGGQVTASLYKVDEFSLQGYVVNDFVFAVSPYVGKNNDGLLGMNYLGAFDFHIDQKNNVLMLKNK